MIRRTWQRGPGLWLQPQHHHQRDDGGEGQERAIFRAAWNAVAFIQCAGSRDENHLPYCSAFCCVASIKAGHVRQGGEPRGRGIRGLQGRAHPGPVRGHLPRGPALGRGLHPPRPRRLPHHQRRGRQAGRGDQGRAAWTTTVRLEELDLVVWPPAWCPTTPRWSMLR